METNTKQNHETFLNIYFRQIYEKLKEIDLFLKTSDELLLIDEISNFLSLETSEIQAIMYKQNIQKLDKSAFMKIMEHGTSKICLHYQRELHCGSPYFYTIEQIAYIYDINFEIVNVVCNKLRIKQVTPQTLPELFSNIMA